MSYHAHTSKTQDIFRIILGIFMTFAAIGHLTFLRTEFQAQVPDWIAMNKNIIVIVSGVVELAFGLALLFWSRQKVIVGISLAIFYIIIFPGNVSQYANDIDAFGLDTDNKRLIRLFFQPLLIWWALWCTGAITAIRHHMNDDDDEE